VLEISTIRNNVIALSVLVVLVWLTACILNTNTCIIGYPWRVAAQTFIDSGIIITARISNRWQAVRAALINSIIVGVCLVIGASEEIGCVFYSE
jgi:hypothetical protein